MTVPAYEDTGLPYSPLVDSWQQPDLYQDPVETEMEGGNVRLRSAPGDDVEHIQFDILYTQAQYTTFKTFVKTTLNNGSSRFTMKVWMGSAFEVRTVQFAKKPVPNAVFPKVRVSFELRVF